MWLEKLEEEEEWAEKLEEVEAEWTEGFEEGEWTEEIEGGVVG